MSADNWTYCPKCKLTAEQDVAKRIQKAEQAYGKVPAEEYLKLRAEAESPPKLDETFREDYGLGVASDGVFSISYSGHCTVCGHYFKFQHEEDTLLKSK